PHAATHLNAAEAWELAGNRARAAEMCDRVLADGAAEPKYTEVARARLARLAPRIATVDVVGKNVAQTSVDGGPACAIPHPFRLAPGHQEGRRRDRRVGLDVGGGDVRALDLPAPAPPAAPTTGRVVSAPTASKDEASAVHAPPLVSWVAFGTSALALGVGAAF